MDHTALDRARQAGVVASFENPERDRCVDIFVRADGSFGYEEWRREAEEPGRWFRVHNFSAAMFGTPALAIADATLKVAWFDGQHHY
jgi:hypothetical protein